VDIETIDSCKCDFNGVPKGDFIEDIDA